MYCIIDFSRPLGAKDKKKRNKFVNALSNPAVTALGFTGVGVGTYLREKQIRDVNSKALGRLGLATAGLGILGSAYRARKNISERRKWHDSGY